MIDTPGATNEQIFWIISTAYIGKAVGLLDKATENKLDALFLGKAQNWTEQVEHALSINEAFVKGVYNLCMERNSRRHPSDSYSVDLAALNPCGRSLARAERDVILLDHVGYSPLFRC